MVAPDALDEVVRRHDLVALDDQRREDGALAPPAEAVRTLLSEFVMQQVQEKGLAGAEPLPS